MRRFILATLAVLVAAVGSLQQVHPASANFGSCFSSDQQDVYYNNGYGSNVGSGGTLVTDSFYPPSDPRHSHRVYTDLAAYRMVHVVADGSLHCLKGYYGSVWTDDGTPANVQVHLDTWQCGSPGPSFTSSNRSFGSATSRILDYGYGEIWGPRQRVVTWGAQDGTSVNPITTAAVTLPNGEVALVEFYDYGSFGPGFGGGCGNQVTNSWTNAGTGTWTDCGGNGTVIAAVSSCSGVQVYLNENRMS